MTAFSGLSGPLLDPLGVGRHGTEGLVPGAEGSDERMSELENTLGSPVQCCHCTDGNTEASGDRGLTQGCRGLRGKAGTPSTASPGPRVRLSQHLLKVSWAACACSCASPAWPSG